MKNEKLPNKLTNLRLILSGIIIIILVFPFNMLNINFKKYLVDNIVIVDLIITDISYEKTPYNVQTDIPLQKK